MNIFNFFSRNKNAKTTPAIIQDFQSAIDIETRNDAVSYACIDRIANSFASLSFGIYDSRTKQKIDNPLYETLKEPNADETHSLFFYNLIRDYYNGNVYLYKYTDNDGNVTNLFRLNPNSVIVSRNEFNQKTYNYYGNVYTSEKVLHIPSRFGYDGKTGKSIFYECRNIFDNARNLDSFTNNSFENDLGKRLIIDISKAFPNATPEEQLKIRQKYINDYSGTKNSGKPIVKSGNIDFSTIDSGTADNRSSQLIENKQYQIKVLSELFGIPESYLNGDASDLESSTTLYITNAIEPLCRTFQEAFNKLLPVQDREKYYIEFNYNSLLKTSLTSKIDAYTKQLNNGILSVNEIRNKENLSNVEAGENHFISAALSPLNDETINAYMAKSKIALAEAEQKSDIENAETAGTVPDRGSDKI